MNSVEILFKTRRFNLSEVGEHFINPCCFGEDLAAWLREKLVASGIDAGQPYQEDWGWEFSAERGGNKYFFGMGGIPDGAASEGNAGEWRVFVEKKRSIWQWLTNSERLSTNDAMALIVEQILRSQSDFKGVHFEV